VLVFAVAHPVAAATVPITNTLDSGPGSLRQAMYAANDGDTVAFAPTVFSVPLTITLTSGQIEITKSLRIDGSSAGVVTPTISGNGNARVFTTNAGHYVTLVRLRIVNGHCASCEGGGIYNVGNLCVYSSVLEGNTADDGGGVFNAVGAYLYLEHSIVISNSASMGGGIYNAGSLDVAISTFTDNSASDVGGGSANVGTLYILDSTLAGNHGPLYGGGLDNGGTANLINVTLANNSATQDGGGIFNRSTLHVTNGTFAGNSPGPALGGGLDAYDGTATLTNTLLAGNGGANCVTENGNIVDGGHNLDSGGSCGFSASHASFTHVDPRLGLLQINPVGPDSSGQAIATLALLPGSLAIDAGDDAECPSTDERGLVRPQPAGGHCDIGAYEAYLHKAFLPSVSTLSYQPTGITITNTKDSGPGSLRQAVLDAAANGTILFSPAVFSVPLTITLTGGEIDINQSLTIDGSAGRVTTSTIDSGRRTRVLQVAASATVALNGLRIVNGMCNTNTFPGHSCNGGGVLNRGTLTVSGTTFISNTATAIFDGSGGGNGGGIANYGTLNVVNSVFVGNSVMIVPSEEAGGGAIGNFGTLRVVNSTFRDNSAGQDSNSFRLGGGIFNAVSSIEGRIVTGTLYVATEY
jgi:hypothetical protein